MKSKNETKREKSKYKIKTIKNNSEDKQKNNTLKIKNEMNLTFMNKSENEFLARTAVISFLTNLNPTVSWLNEIKTAVSEGVTNSIIHAYGSKEGIVELNAKIDHEKVIINIKDNGKGIKNLKNAKEKNFHKNINNERAGMGFQIMETFVDKLTINSIENEGTTITLEKMLLQ